jgi:hypothetical protein
MASMLHQFHGPVSRIGLFILFITGIVGPDRLDTLNVHVVHENVGQNGGETIESDNHLCIT